MTLRGNTKKALKQLTTNNNHDVRIALYSIYKQAFQGFIAAVPVETEGNLNVNFCHFLKINK